MTNVMTEDDRVEKARLGTIRKLEQEIADAERELAEVIDRAPALLVEHDQAEATWWAYARKRLEEFEDEQETAMRKRKDAARSAYLGSLDRVTYVEEKIARLRSDDEIERRLRQSEQLARLAARKAHERETQS